MVHKNILLIVAAPSILLLTGDSNSLKMSLSKGKKSGEAFLFHTHIFLTM
jgi:hypothetical protein